MAHFDNSPFNPFNPDPKATVRYGLQTVDEMFNGFVFYVDKDEALNLTVDEKTGRVRSQRTPPPAINDRSNGFVSQST